MTIKLSNREWEALSAYLDGQLSQKARQQLDVRLQNNPEMQAGLEELRRTRAVLRSQPRLRAPRSFTLTPEMAGIKPGERRQPSIYPFLRLASAFASILLVLVLVGDFFTASAPLLAASEAPAAQEAFGAEAFGFEGTLTPDELERMEQAPPGMGGEAPEDRARAFAVPEGEADAAAEAEAGLAMEAPAEPAAEPEVEALLAEPAPEEGEPSLAAPAMPKEAPAQEEAGAAEAAPIEESAPAEAPAAGETAAEEPAVPMVEMALPEEEQRAEDMAAGALEAEQNAEILAEPRVSPAQTFFEALGPNTWRLIEGILAVLALATGLAAFLVRRAAGS